MSMKKIVLGVAALFFTALFFKQNVFAYDVSRSNNKIGMHLAQPHLSDLKKVAELVNSNGGDWGYVTLVMEENDRNFQKWQEIFDLLRQYHLIPIIRLATHPDGAHWRKPGKEDAQGWSDFLNSLNWVVKNHYVILFNEPNHGSEWGGAVDASDYAETAKEFAEKLKGKNQDFFVMLAAIDASAPNIIPAYLGEEYFLQQFFQKVSVEDFERLFDGIASHSYPNPAFSGTPWDGGRGTVRSYDWELGLFRSFGIQKNLPIFITETGWSAQRLSRATIASYFQTAYQNVWIPDSRVVAVTPFVFDYQAEPFIQFSWKMYQSEELYPQYYTVQSLAKIKGEPEQIDTGILTADLPKELVASSNYHLRIRLKNTGQAIWDKKDGYELRMTNFERTSLEYFSSDIKQVKPFEEADIDVYIKTGNSERKNNANIVLVKKETKIFEIKDWSFEIVPLPSIEFKTALFPKLITNGDRFEMQIFDEKNELVFKRAGLHVSVGKGMIQDVQNIIPDRKYRVVILNPRYLPRQTRMVLKRGDNSIQFKTMYPLDLNENGRLDIGDFITLLKNPKLIQLLFP